ncbi:hypothetical protein [Novosphingobium sp. Chol11]|uniref:hypothetical protein n=1 Tax=Novosphingobium sp. Chol11 TaxID=1385763 RepID=UPI0025E99557|nr:hypothetical protein [Novosphingobium sp. Chol11]
MRKLILIATLAAATLMPAMAQARPYAIHRERAEIRQDLARLQYARRTGNVRQERLALRELREDRRDLQRLRRQWHRRHL